VSALSILPNGPSPADAAAVITTESGAGDRLLIPAIWAEVWRGKLTADTWEPVRHSGGGSITDDTAAENDRHSITTADSAYSPFGGASSYRRIPKALRDRWKHGAPLAGRWYSLERETLPEDTAEDPWYQDELDRERVRLLLRRWGILCRPLLERETPSGALPGKTSWARLLPTMRRMELAGELIAGRFFSGINSLQFASPAILRELEEAERFAGAGPAAESQETSPPLFWMNAADPASPAGLDIEGLDMRLPARSPRNRLYYAGAELAAVSTRNGKELHLFIPPEDPRAEELTELIKIPRLRNVNPEKKLVLETINGTSAAHSPYGPVFITHGFISDRGKLFLW
jgi:ATP-dependent Lhr-like helicase